MANDDKNRLPASFLYKHREDPAHGLQGVPPNFGQQYLEHIHTVNGRYGLVSHSYLNSDEALRDSRTNAYRMRNDCGIMESLHARQRATAMLNWHIEAPNPQSYEQQKLVASMTQILEETPRFTEMRRCLLEGLWFGRYMTTATYEPTYINGKQQITVHKWEPRNGDKLKFRYDDGSLKYSEDQIGIRVGTAYMSPRHFLDPNTGDMIQKVQPTEEGLTYWLDIWERRMSVVHRHMIEDGPWWEPKLAGKINGVGIRDHIYWDWYAMIECLQRVVEYLDRAAFGIEVWPYAAGNDRAKKATAAAAKEAMGGGRTVILAPLQQGEDAELYLPKLIEPGLGGISTTIDMIRTYWGHKIKRFILGQVLSSEAEATGLGSGVADAHLATLADIVQYDAVNLEETISVDFLRQLQLWNHPDSRNIRLKFRIDTEDPDPDRKMASFKSAWEMGLKIKASEVADVIGAAMPDKDDDVLENPAINNAMNAGAMPPNIPTDADGDGLAGEGTPQQHVPPPDIEQTNAGGDEIPPPGVPPQQPIDLGNVMDRAAANGNALRRSEQGRQLENRILSYLHRANGSKI